MSVRYDESMATVIHWNGEQVPEELRALPRGRYVIEAVDDAPGLTDEQEAGIVAATRSIDEGRGLSLAEAKRKVEEALRR